MQELLGENQEGSTARTETPAPRVLPADIYDTFEFSALAYGGIGRGQWFTIEGDNTSDPVCIAGHAYAVDSDNGPRCLRWQLYNWDIDTAINDRAVRAINARENRPPYARVSWPEYTRELNIVRGD